MESRPEFDEAEIPQIQEESERDEPSRGWQPSAESMESIAGEESKSQVPSEAQSVSDTSDAQRIEAGLSRLETTDAGKSITQTIQDRGTTVGFGKTQEGAIAQFDPSTNAITIDESQGDASPNVIAAHLAHEGTHAGWDKPSRTDSLEHFAEDYVDEEYHAFKAQAEVWETSKGQDESDRQCEWVSAMISKGEAEAKAQVQRMYGDNIVRAWLDTKRGA